MQSSEAAQFRRSLHGENESCADRHETNHGKGVNPDFEHLSHSRLPAVTIPYKGQRSPHGAQCGPPLDIQTSDVVEVFDRSLAEIFESVSHQDSLDSDELVRQPLASNKASKPVTSNK